MAALAVELVGVSNAQTGDIDIRWSDNRLSASIDSVTISEVMEAIADATGAEVKVTGEFEPISAQSFEDVTLEAALRRLLGNHSFLVLYGEPVAGEEAKQVRFIHVYARSPTAPARTGAGLQRPLREELAERTRRVRELTQQDDDDAIQELQRLLGAETESSLRRQIVGALVSIGTPRAAEVLAQAMKDTEPAIRTSAAQGLWNLEGDAAADGLRAALETEQDEQVRRVIEQLLARAQAGAAR